MSWWQKCHQVLDRWGRLYLCSATWELGKNSEPRHKLCIHHLASPRGRRGELRRNGLREPVSEAEGPWELREKREARKMAPGGVLPPGPCLKGIYFGILFWEDSNRIFFSLSGVAFQVTVSTDWLWPGHRSMQLIPRQP